MENCILRAAFVTSITYNKLEVPLRVIDALLKENYLHRRSRTFSLFFGSKQKMHKRAFSLWRSVVRLLVYRPINSPAGSCVWARPARKPPLAPSAVREISSILRYFLFGYCGPLWPGSLCAWPRLNGHTQGVVSWDWWVCQMKILIEMMRGHGPLEENIQGAGCEVNLQSACCFNALHRFLGGGTGRSEGAKKQMRYFLFCFFFNSLKNVIMRNQHEVKSFVCASLSLWIQMSPQSVMIVINELCHKRC